MSSSNQTPNTPSQGNDNALETQDYARLEDVYQPSGYIKRVFHFMRYRRFMAIVSALVVLVGVGAVFVKGLNLGLDFTGGVSAEARYEMSVAPNDVRAKLSASGYENPVVQYLDSQRDLQVRVPPQTEEHFQDKLTEALQLEGNPANVLKIDSIGAQVGGELYLNSLIALGLALLSMLIYIAFRFQIKLAVGAVISLVHDTLFVIGTFAIFGWPFDFSVLAAVLALIGYSLNDTIVVFDRIRENFRKLRGLSAVDIVDISISETMRRTIMTVVTVLFVVIAMLFFGGEGLKWFSVALLVGLIAGTYSSVYIASSYALTAGLDRSDFVVKIKPEFEDEEVEFE